MSSYFEEEIYYLKIGLERSIASILPKIEEFFKETLSLFK